MNFKGIPSPKHAERPQLTFHFDPSILWERNKARGSQRQSGVGKCPNIKQRQHSNWQSSASQTACDSPCLKTDPRDARGQSFAQFRCGCLGAPQAAYVKCTSGPPRNNQVIRQHTWLGSHHLGYPFGFPFITPPTRVLGCSAKSGGLPRG